MGAESEPPSLIERLVLGVVVSGLGGTLVSMSSFLPAAAAPSVEAKIAFVRDRGGESHIFVMNQDGTKPTEVSKALGGSPAWSADGRKLAFISSRATGDRPQVYMMNADGSHQTRLTHDAMHDSNPSWSPDGTKIVFEGEDGIFVLTLRTKALSRLTKDNNAEPAWSPDGATIVFERTRDVPNPTNLTGMDQVSELWTMAADGSQPKQLTSPPVSFSGPTTTILGKDEFPAWSPDGTRIAFESNRASNNGIFEMNADGSNIIAVTHPQGVDEFPSWSPDGTKIAFARTGEPVLSATDQIYSVSIDGSNPTALTSSAAGATSPAWQPKNGVRAQARPRR
jgi:Tol biopolymer transport system component